MKWAEPSLSAQDGLLTFSLDAQTFALWLRDTVSVIGAVAITPLAGAPPVVEGIVNVRGDVVPVFGIRARFGLPPVPVRRSDQLLLARTADRTVALRVDRALAIVEVAPGELTEIQEVARSAGGVAGVARLAHGLTVIADLETFLTAAEADELGRALARTEEDRIEQRGSHR